MGWILRGWHTFTDLWIIFCPAQKGRWIDFIYHLCRNSDQSLNERIKNQTKYCDNGSYRLPKSFNSESVKHSRRLSLHRISAHKIFLDVNCLTAPNGPLLASSKICKSCNRGWLVNIHNHLNWPIADATVKSSKLFDIVAKIETTKLRERLWNNVGKCWPSYFQSMKTSTPKVTRLSKMANNSPIHQSTNEFLTRAQILALEDDMFGWATLKVDCRELSSQGYSKSSILLLISKCELQIVWNSSMLSRLWWTDIIFNFDFQY